MKRTLILMASLFMLSGCSHFTPLGTAPAMNPGESEAVWVVNKARTIYRCSEGPDGPICVRARYVDQP